VPPDILKKSFTFVLPFDSLEKYQKKKNQKKKKAEKTSTSHHPEPKENSVAN
jgi:hypothetical protein